MSKSKTYIICNEQDLFAVFEDVGDTDDFNELQVEDNNEAAGDSDIEDGGEIVSDVIDIENNEEIEDNIVPNCIPVRPKKTYFK